PQLPAVRRPAWQLEATQDDQRGLGFRRRHLLDQERPTAARDRQERVVVDPGQSRNQAAAPAARRQRDAHLSRSRRLRGAAAGHALRRLLMADWDPQQYEKFKRERDQPFWDLLSLVRAQPGMRVADLGCG